jgi:dTDP-4-amino-4,6-dideoxygalactose transaminase
MKRIPFMSPGSAYEELRSDIDDAVARVLRSGHYILGEEVEAFERAWAGFCGATHAVGLSDGLAALTLSLQALDIGPGDEVIVPAHTFIATWLAVSKCGALPVPVDADPASLGMDHQAVAAAITERTRAILPVHLYGQPIDLDPLLALAQRHALPVVEDAAQAHGARYKGRPIGNHGTLACWSFYPAKNLGAIGDAGAVTTSDDALADKLRLLRNYGSREKYVHVELGENSRLDPIQAAILGAKLPHLEAWNARRDTVAARYLERLRDLPLRLPALIPDAESSWHLFAIRNSERDALRDHLAAAGIDCLIHYPIPPHLQDAYAPLGHRKGAFPIAERIAAETLSLPIGPHMGLDDADRVCDAIAGFWSSRR